jgi:hypothetical protein
VRAHFLGTLTALIVVTLATSVAASRKASYDYDKTADFAALKTFTFKPGTGSGRPLVDDRITAAIAAELTARGMTRNETSPDVYVVTHLTFDKQKDISTFSTGYGPYGWAWGGGWGSTDVQVREITMGTLVVDLIDAHKGAVVWRGMATKEVKQHTDPSKIDKNVNEAVAKIMSNYPPKVAAS